MNRIKFFIQKNWVLIGWLFAFVVDNAFGILANSGLTHLQIELIKGFGAALYAYLWTSKHNLKIALKNFKLDAKNNN